MVTRQQRDVGFSLIELLLVIVMLAILTTIVVISVGGITADAEHTGCDADRKLVATAAEAYFAQHRTEVIPADPGDLTPNTYEATLVDAGFLGGTSEYFDLDAAGRLVQVATSPCTA